MKKFEQMLFLINANFMMVEMAWFIIKLGFIPSLPSCTMIYMSIVMIIVNFIFLMIELIKRPEDF